MKILRTSGVQNVKIIPRPFSGDSVSVKLRDRTKNTTRGLTTTYIEDGNYLDVTFSIGLPSLRADSLYDLYFYDNTGDLIYRDTAIVTDQVIDQEDNDVYNINDNQYKEHNTGDNDYIIVD